LYGAGRSGDIVVISKYCPTASGWAILVVCAAGLALGGCGRKGGLDLPPNAAAQPIPGARPAVASSAPAPVDSQTEAANQPSVFNPYYGTDAPPTASKGQKKPFILDPLLDSGPGKP
jgi:predicted small lipoprotein YifL